LKATLPSPSKLWNCLVALLLLIPGLARANDTNRPALARHLPDLVVVKADHFVPFKSGRFVESPYLVLYFGAGWCPDCRRFSPALVAAYDHQDPQHRQFEVLFLTKDKSGEAMLKFMLAEKMKWPAVAFDKITAASDLNRYYSGHGIPCLSVIDQSGNLVAQSKSDQDALEILDQIEVLIKGKK